MEWTNKEFFYIVKYMGDGVYRDPRYSKLPFRLKNKVIADLLHSKLRKVRDAVKANGRFSEFKKYADPYLSQKSFCGKSLFEFVQYCHVWMPLQEEYKDKSSPELAEIIGRWVGCSKNTIR